MSVRPPSLSIFFPCYNDSHTISLLVKKAFEIAPTLTKNFEVIVVNDGSTDESAQVLEHLKQKHPSLKIVTHTKNKGYGAALRSGFKASTKKLIFYTDGDGQYSVSELPILYNLMSKDVDFVNGIKMARHDPTYRVFIGNLYSFITRWLFWLPITDVDCDFRLIRRSLLKKLKLKASSGHVCVELVKSAHRAHASFREVSVHHFKRVHDSSQFFQPRHLITTFSGLAKIWTQFFLFHRFSLPKLSRRLYYFLIALILIFAFALRIIPPLGNNFYFTMDQANDALHVREILVHHKLPLLGPETSIFGLYAGPLWYYFIAIGYFLFNGHPFGGIFTLIILNVFTLFIIIRRVSQEISPIKGLVIGLALQTSWWFYDLSRYSFNPFPCFFLSIIGIFWLTDFLRGQTNKYILAAIPFTFFFHTDVASAIPANLMFFGLGVVSVLIHKLPLRKFVVAIFIAILSFSPHLVSELIHGFPQANILINQLRDPNSVFSSSQVLQISQRFSLIIARSLYRQTPDIGLLAFSLVLILFFKKIHNNQLNPFIKNFIFLSFGLFVCSWLFFITNLGWRDWQTAFLSPLIFLAVLLALTEIPTLLSVSLIALSIYSHVFIFADRYQQNLHPTSDPSLLVNEIAAIDWVYQNSQGQGFSNYSYLPSVYDYPYQYLFWWYGLPKYDYLPCEYASFPGDPHTSLPDSKNYRTPVKDCPSKLRFLIIEPDQNTNNLNQWISNITPDTNLLKETRIGKITVQKRLLTK